MKKQPIWRWAVLFLLGCGMRGAVAADEQAIAAPDGLTFSIKKISPLAQPTELQVLCVLQHDPAGDRYVDVMAALDAKLGKLLSRLRDRGDFVGEPGETLLFTPPGGSIAPRRVLLIGMGPEAALSLDRLRLAGTIAAREAVRLQATEVSFAPTLRDQGSSRINVGDGDAAFAEAFIRAYETETRLAADHLTPAVVLSHCTIEAGAKFFDDVVKKVSASEKAVAAEINARGNQPLLSR